MTRGRAANGRGRSKNFRASKDVRPGVVRSGDPSRKTLNLFPKGPNVTKSALIIGQDGSYVSGRSGRNLKQVSGLAHIRAFVNKGLSRRGWELARYPASHSAAYKRNLILRAIDADVVVDVGANTGQFGQEIRDHGFKGGILSFEPLPEAYSALERRAAKDPRWMTFNSAIGAASGTLNLHVAANSVSSSTLKMLDRHREAAPNSATVAQISVPVARLDSIPGLPIQSKGYLKVDTQGFEEQVLEGAGKDLSRFGAVELELTLTPLYEGQALFDAILLRLSSAGYRLAGVYPGFWDKKTGETLQFDGIFLRCGS
jgi:FkbM family methyltransferase